MNFSLTAFLATVLAVLLSGAVAFMEGTLTNRRVKMGFLNHGGMWGDLVIMSTATGLAFPYFVRSRMLALAALALALAVTLVAHGQWAKWMRSEGVSGHIFPAHKTGKWYRDISLAGWMHVAVMTLLLAAMIIYAVSPLPGKNTVTISVLLTVHVFLSALQPGWYCTGEWRSWRSVAPPLVAAALIWCVAGLKIHFASGPV